MKGKPVFSHPFLMNSREESSIKSEQEESSTETAEKISELDHLPSLGLKSTTEPEQKESPNEIAQKESPNKTASQEGRVESRPGQGTSTKPQKKKKRDKEDFIFTEKTGRQDRTTANPKVEVNVRHPITITGISVTNKDAPNRTYELKDATVTAPLKVDDAKIVAKATFDGPDLVLKIAVGQGVMVYPNVLAGQCIRLMGLDGITAPSMNFCAPTQESLNKVIAEVIEFDRVKYETDMLRLQAEMLKRTIETTPVLRSKWSEANEPVVSTAALVSGAVQGKEVNNLVATMGAADSPLYQITKTPEEARQEYGSKTKTETGSQKKPAKGSVQSLWPTKGKADPSFSPPPESSNEQKFRDWLTQQDNFVNGLTTEKGNLPNSQMIKTKFELQMLLAQMGAPLAATAVKSTYENVNISHTFKVWLGTKEGTSAVIRLACVDLMFGMEDRLIIRYHGGNFMFDGNLQQLMCIDNAKDGPHLGENQQTYAAWVAKLNTIAKTSTLKDAMVAIINSRNQVNFNGLLLNEEISPENIENILRDVAGKASAAADGDIGDTTAEGRLRDRTLYIVETLQVENKIAPLLLSTNFQSIMLDLGAATKRLDDCQLFVPSTGQIDAIKNKLVPFLNQDYAKGMYQDWSNAIARATDRSRRPRDESPVKNLSLSSTTGFISAKPKKRTSSIEISTIGPSDSKSIESQKISSPKERPTLSLRRKEEISSISSPSQNITNSERTFRKDDPTNINSGQRIQVGKRSPGDKISMKERSTTSPRQKEKIFSTSILSPNNMSSPPQQSSGEIAFGKDKPMPSSSGQRLRFTTRKPRIEISTIEPLDSATVNISSQEISSTSSPIQNITTSDRTATAVDKTAASTVEAAQKIWGDQLLPSDTQSIETIEKLMQWSSEQSPEPSDPRIILLLSVGLQTNHPELLESKGTFDST